MPPATRMTEGLAEARGFAESVAGVIGRHGPAETGAWVPGSGFDDPWPELTTLLDDLGWETLAHDDGLAPYAGLGAFELGRGLGSIGHVDRLLGASPLAGELVRSVSAERLAVAVVDGVGVRRPIVRCEPCPSAEGLDVHRIVELGDAVAIDPEAWRMALGAWLAAGVGYLAGLGQGALDLTVDYVRQRRAFGSTLGALGPVQQLLAAAATAVRGVRLLAGEAPDADGLAHAGAAVTEACAACHQVTGAIGFTLEYPLQRYTQRARALAIWNDALLDALIER